MPASTCRMRTARAAILRGHPFSSHGGPPGSLVGPVRAFGEPCRDLHGRLVTRLGQSGEASDKPVNVEDPREGDHSHARHRGRHAVARHMHARHVRRRLRQQKHAPVVLQLARCPFPHLVRTRQVHPGPQDLHQSCLRAQRSIPGGVADARCQDVPEFLHRPGRHRSWLACVAVIRVRRSALPALEGIVEGAEHVKRPRRQEHVPQRRLPRGAVQALQQRVGRPPKLPDHGRRQEAGAITAA